MGSFDDAASLEAAVGVSAVLAAEVRSVAELAETPWAAERGAFVDVDVSPGAAIRVPRSPWRFSDADTGARPGLGFRGEDNREVLGALLRLDDAELDRLQADGVLSERVPVWWR